MDTTASEPQDRRSAREVARPVQDVLASDAEREAVALLIQQAAAEGRLTPTEADDRLGTLYASRYRGDFPALTRDLPKPDRAGPATPDRRRPLLYPGLALHAVLVLVVAIGLITRWAVSPVLFFWPIWPIFWLTVSILIHARIRRGGRPPWARRWDGRPWPEES